jgi:hypothetical protein
MSDRFAGGVKAGSTSVSVPILLRNTSDNTEKTGVAFGSVTATYRRQGAASVAITAVALPTPAITDAWTSGGWFEADATNQPGTYRLDVPNAAFVTGADWVIVAVKVAGAFVHYERFNLETVGAAEVYARVGAPTGASIAADIQTRSTFAGGAVAAVTGNVGGSVGSVTAPVTAGTVTDKTGYSLTSVYDPAKTAAQAGNAMALTTGERNALAGVILTDTTDTLGADILAIKAVTDKLATGLQADGSGGYQFTVLALAHVPTGGGGSDPWAAALPGSYSAGSAGYILGQNLDARVSTRSAFDPTATGVHLTSAGLDAVVIESGINARQALSPILAFAAGGLSGAGTGTILIKGGNSSTTRIAATTDSAGNRTSVTLTLPS